MDDIFLLKLYLIIMLLIDFNSCRPIYYCISCKFYIVSQPE